ncbi:hypothetical protein DICA4_A01926 [Diutina catenulata]
MSDDESTTAAREPGRSLYDDSITIKNYPTSYNLDDKIDFRNVKYKSPTDHLNCPICQQPFIEPLTTVCGHTFCKECIQECFKMAKDGDTHKGSCPLDRTPLDATNINELFPTPLIITNLVDDLKVYCLNGERGCDWSGSRWELEHHVMIECGYTGVKCNGLREREPPQKKKKRVKREKHKPDDSVDPQESADDTADAADPSSEEAESDSESAYEAAYNAFAAYDLDPPTDYEPTRCGLVVERKYLDNSEECVHRRFTCEFCKQELCKITEQWHLDHECLFNYQTCDLCFNDCIAKRNLEKHQQNCTRVGHLACPARTIGCSWVGGNETSLEIHQKSCALSQFLPSYTRLTEQVSGLTSENQFLQKQINKILDSIIQGKVTNLGYAEALETINSNSDAQQLLCLNFELDRLKYEVNEKIIPHINKHSGPEQESMISNMINDTFMMREDLNVQRMVINSLRKQLQFLMFSRGPRPMMGPPMAPTAMGYDEMASELLDVSSRSSSEERFGLKL